MMILLAVVVPPLTQAVLMIAFHGSQWLNQYGPIVVLGQLAMGSIFLFRALQPRYAFPCLLLYVPLGVLLIHGAGLVVAGAVFNDYL